MNTTATPLAAARANVLVTAVVTAEAALESNPWSYETAGAHDELKKKLAVAREDLSAAIVAAPWGTNGSLFISDRKAGVCSWNAFRRLYVNGRLRATLEYSCGTGSSHRVDVVPADQAEAEFQAHLVAVRVATVQFRLERQRLIDALRWYDHAKLDSFADWDYRDGQKGGTFRRLGSDFCLPALGALSAAFGPDLESHVPTPPRPVEEAEWDRAIYGARW